MSSIRTIKQQLEPWDKIRGQTRYYVNDWVDRIYGQLVTYRRNHPNAPEIEQMAKWAKVWYDGNGTVHVDGLYDKWLTNFIAETMERTQFLDSEYDPSFGSIELRWDELIKRADRRDEGETAVFTYNGREFLVNKGFLYDEICNNKAYIGMDGEVIFESESSDLTELILELIKTELPKMPELLIPKTLQPLYGAEGLFGFAYSPPTDIRLNPDDPELARCRDFEGAKTHTKESWTKEEVLRVCRFVDIPAKAISKLEDMSEGEIRSRFLVGMGQSPEGKVYRLNLSAIGKLAKRDD